MPSGADCLVTELLAEDPGALRAVILRALTSAGGLRTRAAHALGMSPELLSEWIRVLDLDDLIAQRWPRKV